MQHEGGAQKHVEQLKQIVQGMERIGLWARDSSLPCPEDIWNDLLNPFLPPIAIGLLARVKETIKGARDNLDYLLMRARTHPDTAIAEDLYYLFVFYEYPLFRRAIYKYMLPKKRKIFDTLLYVLNKLDGGGSV